jgi:hypothetical protein
MMRLLMLSGDLTCDLADLPADSDHRIILRMFINTMVWGAVMVAAALAIMV